MVDNNKLSKDVEEQIQSLASDVYIQVEEKLTHLITTAVKAELGKTNAQQSKELSAKEQTLQKGFAEQQQVQVKELEKLKQALAEKETDQEAAKQNFQVELTQKTINFTETIEQLEKQLVSLKQESSSQQTDQQKNDKKLEEKLLEAEQKLNDKTHEVDGLNGRIMVLTEQEQSLSKQLASANESIKLTGNKQVEAITAAKNQAESAAKQQIDALNTKIQQNEKQHSEAITAAKNQAEAAAKKQIDALNETIQQSEKQHTEAIAATKSQAEATAKQHSEALAVVKTEAEKAATGKVTDLEQKISQLTEQAKQDENAKAELQQQISAQQKASDTEQDKIKQAEQRDKDYQAKIVTLTEQAEAVKQKHLEQITSMNEETGKINQLHVDEIKAIQDAGEEAKGLQATAQQKIIELEKSTEELTKQLETEQSDVKLYQQEVVVLNEQLKVAQDGQENILQRFNSNREKQEIENNKVRETIKFLRDENHQLMTDATDQKNQFTEQINELEHKITEYRLKFEYAQKQLAK